MRLRFGLARRFGALALLSLLGLGMPSTVAAKNPPGKAPDSTYVSALATANRLLEAWENGDGENGMALLTTRAKELATTDGVEKFFSNSSPSGYEITRGKLIKSGHYEFPVALMETGPNHRTRRRFSSLVIVNTGHNDWAVDKLP